jgi:hypothetical protein
VIVDAQIQIIKTSAQRRCDCIARPSEPRLQPQLNAATLMTTKQPSVGGLDAADQQGSDP